MADIPAPVPQADDKLYKSRIRAWAMYDWANSAFYTTILAAVLPVYYSSVAGSTLPSRATATQYWSTTLTLSVLVIALLSPILGTVSDLMRGKKRFLAVFLTLGVIGSSLLYFVEEGDWLLASAFMMLAYIGFGSANVFYDSLLPHVAREDDQDRVSSFGYALGYLGGGLLLAINVVMIQLLPGTLGVRLSFLTVGVWAAVFALPILLRVPEPAGKPVGRVKFGELVKISFGQLGRTMGNIRKFKDLFRFLVSFLIYNDGINAVISIAVIYGAELGFESTQLILAILLVQFAGIPYSLIFGSLPRNDNARQPKYVAFIIYNMVMLPFVGMMARQLLAPDQVGNRLPDYVTVGEFVGQGIYGAADTTQSGTWSNEIIAADLVGTDDDLNYVTSTSPGNALAFPFNGRSVEIGYTASPDAGEFAVLIDGQEVEIVDANSKTVRYGESVVVAAESGGNHTLSIEHRSGDALLIGDIDVKEPARESNLGLMLGLLFGTQAVGLAFAWLTGNRLFAGLARWLNTKRSISLAILFYCVIAVWGFFLDSAVEFWFLAWMVATVQGGSQALSRSLYASMSPKAMSGEFFGFYSILSKFASFLSPLIFVVSVWLFQSSRPGILSLVVVFIIGLLLLSRVNVPEGRAVAKAEDVRLASEGR